MENSATLIDDIINNESRLLHLFLMMISKDAILDHYPILSEMDTKNNAVYQTKAPRTRRMLSEENKHKFQVSLHETNWENVLENQTAEVSCERFYDHFRKCINENLISLEQVNINSSGQAYISPELKNIIQQRNHLHTKFMRNRNDRNWENYLSDQNHVKLRVCNAKREYIQ